MRRSGGSCGSSSARRAAAATPASASATRSSRSSIGTGSPWRARLARPHLRRDWAHPSHICAGTDLRIGESNAHFIEQWHQKLHNNTTPDDVPICEAGPRLPPARPAGRHPSVLWRGCARSEKEPSLHTRGREGLVVVHARANANANAHRRTAAAFGTHAADLVKRCYWDWRCGMAHRRQMPSCTGQDGAHRCDVCTGTGPTSAPGRSPHLHRD